MKARPGLLDELRVETERAAESDDAALAGPPRRG
jgi:hypothetical protein